MKRYNRQSKQKNKSGMSDISLDDFDVDPLIRDCMVKEAFKMFDIDGSGDIDKSEFSKLMAALGLELNEKKQNELMKEIYRDGALTIDYNEFYNVMTRFQFGKESNLLLHLENAFNDFDKDLDGEITFEDLLKVSQELDEGELTKEDAQLLVVFGKYFYKSKGKELDESHALGITKNEFINMLQSLNFLISKENAALGRSSALDLNSVKSMNKSLNKSVNRSSLNVDSEGSKKNDVFGP